MRVHIQPQCARNAIQSQSQSQSQSQNQSQSQSQNQNQTSSGYPSKGPRTRFSDQSGRGAGKHASSCFNFFNPFNFFNHPVTIQRFNASASTLQPGTGMLRHCRINAPAIPRQYPGNTPAI